MSIPFLEELKKPTRWYTQVGIIVFSLVAFGVLATSTIAGFVVYRIVKPQRSSTDINMDSFPGRPDAVKFSVPGGDQRDGWFFPGLMGAPTVVLCHGYGSSRGELLTLVSALQDHQYNVFVFDFGAHGDNGGMTTWTRKVPPSSAPGSSTAATFSSTRNLLSSLWNARRLTNS